MDKRTITLGLASVLMFTAAAGFRWQSHWGARYGMPGGYWFRDIVHPWAYVLAVLTCGLGALCALLTLASLRAYDQRSS